MPVSPACEVEAPTEASSQPDIVSFSVGDIFKTFEELEKKVKEYEQFKSIQLWKRDTRTVQCAQKRMDRPLNSRIKYYEIVYSCIHGDKKFKSKGEGNRASS